MEKRTSIRIRVQTYSRENPIEINGNLFLRVGGFSTVRHISAFLGFLEDEKEEESGDEDLKERKERVGEYIFNMMESIYSCGWDWNK